jgi:hypothetical protein
MKKLPHTLLSVAALLLLASSLSARTESLTVSVRGQKAPDYQRVKLPNGTYKAERYVISNGGRFPGTTTDASMEKVGYPEVAGIVARHLATQQYYLAQKAKDADLLIAIYWGTTIPFNNSRYNTATDQLSTVAKDLKMDTIASRISLETGEIAPGGGGNTGGVVNNSTEMMANLEMAMARVEMENRERDAANAGNAQLLGYLDDINDRRDITAWADVGDLQHDLVADVEEQRYYIVVRAYDFKALQRDGKQLVRWTTRISIGAQGQGFDERFAQMVAAAGNAFGQQQRLRRRFYGDPNVNLGEIKYLGETSLPAAKGQKEEKNN